MKSNHKNRTWRNQVAPSSGGARETFNRMRTIAMQFLRTHNAPSTYYDIVHWALTIAFEVLDKAELEYPLAEGYILEKIDKILSVLGIHAEYMHILFGDKLPFSQGTIKSNIAQYQIAEFENWYILNIRPVIIRYRDHIAEVLAEWQQRQINEKQLGMILLLLNLINKTANV